MYGFRPSYARYATPRTHNIASIGIVRVAAGTIIFRETLFRGMEGAACLTQRLRWSCPLPARLDAIARTIRKVLQDDGRSTNVELSRRVGISAPQAGRRRDADPTRQL